MDSTFAIDQRVDHERPTRTEDRYHVE
jgi:hypothetical protein